MGTRKIYIHSGLIYIERKLTMSPLTTLGWSVRNFIATVKVELIVAMLACNCTSRPPQGFHFPNLQ
jgi:hypothetical protein